VIAMSDVMHERLTRIAHESEKLLEVVQQIVSRVAASSARATQLSASSGECWSEHACLYSSRASPFLRQA
jgi:hypothetical protein